MQPLHCDLQPESQETNRTTHTWTTTHCRTQRRNQSRLVRPQPHPPHTRGTFHRRPEPLYTEKHKVSCPGFPKTKPMSHPCSHDNAFCNFKFPTRISRRTWQHKTTKIMQPLHCDLQPESQETNRTTHTWTTTHCRTQRRNQSRLVRPQPHPPHTRGTFHRRPEPLYTEKHKVSCPGFPPKRGPCNIHAAMTMRFATSSSQPASLDAHSNTKRQRSCSHYTAICNQSQETNRTTHTWTTTHCRTRRRNQSRLVRPQPHPPHTRGTFHRRPEPLYTEKHKVSCTGFPPKRGPCNIHAAMTMRFATSSSQPASLDAHGNTKRQRSCSHYTAICNQRVKKRIELRTREQPLIAEHKGGTNRAWFHPSRTRRTHEVPFIAGRSHFTRKNTRFPAPAFPQNEAHVTSMQPLQCVLQLQVPNPHLSTHMATQNDNDHAAITLRSATRESRSA